MLTALLVRAALSHATGEPHMGTGGGGHHGAQAGSAQRRTTNSGPDARSHQPAEASSAPGVLTVLQVAAAVVAVAKAATQLHKITARRAGDCPSQHAVLAARHLAKDRGKRARQLRTVRSKSRSGAAKELFEEDAASTGLASPNQGPTPQPSRSMTSHSLDLPAQSSRLPTIRTSFRHSHSLSASPITSPSYYHHLPSNPTHAGKFSSLSPNPTCASTSSPLSPCPSSPESHGSQPDTRLNNRDPIPSATHHTPGHDSPASPTGSTGSTSSPLSPTGSTTFRDTTRELSDTCSCGEDPSDSCSLPDTDASELQPAMHLPEIKVHATPAPFIDTECTGMEVQPGATDAAASPSTVYSDVHLKDGISVFPGGHFPDCTALSYCSPSDHLIPSCLPSTGIPHSNGTPSGSSYYTGSDGLPAELVTAWLWGTTAPYSHPLSPLNETGISPAPSPTHAAAANPEKAGPNVHALLLSGSESSFGFQAEGLVELEGTFPPAAFSSDAEMVLQCGTAALPARRPAVSNVDDRLSTEASLAGWQDDAPTAHKGADSGSGLRVGVCDLEQVPVDGEVQVLTTDVAESVADPADAVDAAAAADVCQQPQQGHGDSEILLEAMVEEHDGAVITYAEQNAPVLGEQNTRCAAVTSKCETAAPDEDVLSVADMLASEHGVVENEVTGTSGQPVLHRLSHSSLDPPERDWSTSSSTRQPTGSPAIINTVPSPTKPTQWMSLSSLPALPPAVRALMTQISDVSCDMQRPDDDALSFATLPSDIDISELDTWPQQTSPRVTHRTMSDAADTACSVLSAAISPRSSIRQLIRRSDHVFNSSAAEGAGDNLLHRRSSAGHASSVLQLPPMPEGPESPAASHSSASLQSTSRGMASILCNGEAGEEGGDGFMCPSPASEQSAPLTPKSHHSDAAGEDGNITAAAVYAQSPDSSKSCDGSPSRRLRNPTRRRQQQQSPSALHALTETDGVVFVLASSRIPVLATSAMDSPRSLLSLVSRIPSAPLSDRSPSSSAKRLDYSRSIHSSDSSDTPPRWLSSLGGDHSPRASLPLATRLPCRPCVHTPTSSPPVTPTAAALAAVASPHVSHHHDPTHATLIPPANVVERSELLLSGSTMMPGKSQPYEVPTAPLEQTFSTAAYHPNTMRAVSPFVPAARLISELIQADRAAQRLHVPLAPTTDRPVAEDLITHGSGHTLTVQQQQRQAWSSVEKFCDIDATGVQNPGACSSGVWRAADAETGPQGAESSGTCLRSSWPPGVKTTDNFDLVGRTRLRRPIHVMSQCSQMADTCCDTNSPGCGVSGMGPQAVGAQQGWGLHPTCEGQDESGSAKGYIHETQATRPGSDQILGHKLVEEMQGGNLELDGGCPVQTVVDDEDDDFGEMMWCVPQPLQQYSKVLAFRTPVDASYLCIYTR